MSRAQQIVIHRDIIVIDPWPEPLLHDQYQRLAAWLQSRRDLRQIIWASYESGRIDPLFAAAVKDPRSHVMTPRYPLSPTVWIAGQEWWRCVHARPLGIHRLVSQGYNIQVDLDRVWYRQGGFDLWSSPDSLVDDAHHWRQITERQWLLTATAVNRQIADLHLSQQADQ